MAFNIPDLLTATILISQTDSDEIDIEAHNLFALEMPAAFTGVAITFEAASISGGTFLPVMDGAGAAISLTVAPSQIITLTGSQQAAFGALQFIKLISGSTEVAERAINVIRQ